MALTRGQIRFLYVMVHPGWSAESFYWDTDAELERHYSFLDKVKHNEECALVHVHGFRRYVESSFVFQESMETYDKDAKTALGDRYQVWKGDEEKLHFINSHSRDVNRLARDFNVHPQTHADYLPERDTLISPDKRLFARIITYGKYVEQCPREQAMMLTSLCGSVFYSGRVALDSDPFTADSSSVFGESELIRRTYGNFLELRNIPLVDNRRI